MTMVVSEVISLPQPVSFIAQTISQSVTRVLQDFGVNVPVLIEHPKEEAHGDYSTPVALSLYKLPEMAQRFPNPRVAAAELKNVLLNDPGIGSLVDRIEVAGPGFINFYLKTSVLLGETYRVISENAVYGQGVWGKGKRWLIEHTSPNPNKAMHLGHLRNNVSGMAIANLWAYSGIDVIRDAVDNNRGIAIAKLMWGYLQFARKDPVTPASLDYWYEHQGEWLTPAESNQRPDRFVDELYVKAAEDVKNPEHETKVRQMVVDWEKREPKTWALWERVLDYSHQGQQLTLERLGNLWDYVWHEHEHYQEGKDLVEQGLKQGVFCKTSEGTVITQLGDYNLPDTVVMKSDGTSLYITQDLALTKLKKEKFHPDHLFWVIGPEQSLALKQLFAVCEQLGIGRLDEFTHLAYGYMSIKGQGKMSSRAGNVIYIDELLDMAKAAIKTKIDISRFSTDEVEVISEQVGVGAVKYSILKVGRQTDMAFDIESSVSFDGNSGPYIQYTYARCCSVLAKANNPDLSAAIEDWQFNSEELAIVRWLYRFPEVVAEAALEAAPSHICNYSYELCQRFNAFYNKHTILNLKDAHSTADDQEVQIRLLITASVSQVLKNALGLLGIASPERM